MSSRRRERSRELAVNSWLTARTIGQHVTDATRLREGSLRMRVVVLDPTFALVAAF